MMKLAKYYMAVLFILVCKHEVKSQACLNYSTFFGTLLTDEIRGVCTDKQNNVYVIGNTYNTDLPVTVGAFQSVPKGSYEAFLAKFDTCGNLAWCTYFGTSGFDSGEKIAYSNDNTIVLVGHTDGTDLDTTFGCFQGYNRGAEDCFLAKFSLTGNPIWITYFGGLNGDFAYDLKTDSLSNIVIGGTSLSNGLYTTANSFQQNNQGNTDAFISRFNSNGMLRFSTFYGGTNSEDIHALAVDKNCNVIGVGGSFSFNLSTSAGCYQPSSNGGMEIYVIKLDSSGQRIFSTYIGSAGTDDAYGVCTDNTNQIYVSGHTNSSMFYTSPGAYQPIKNGQNDGYCLSLSPNGTMLWSTFLGGSGNDFMSRMTINSNKELLLLLSSQSTDFPMMGTINNTVSAGSADNVVIKLLTNGSPFWSTYIGGSSFETPQDIATFTSKQKFVIAGTTSSADYPLTGNVFQNTFGGTEDGFVTCYTAVNSTLANVSEALQNTCQIISYYSNLESKMVLNSNCNNEYRYFIYDISGRVVRDKVSNATDLDLMDLMPGIYFFKIINLTTNKFEQIKFLKT